MKNKNPTKIIIIALIIITIIVLLAFFSIKAYTFLKTPDNNNNIDIRSNTTYKKYTVDELIKIAKDKVKYNELDYKNITITGKVKKIEVKDIITITLGSTSSIENNIICLFSSKELSSMYFDEGQIIAVNGRIAKNNITEDNIILSPCKINTNMQITK